MMPHPGRLLALTADRDALRRESPHRTITAASSHRLRCIGKETTMLMPRQPVPALSVPTLAHGDFDLAADAAPQFTLVVFYRGLHCPICLKYLLELGRLQPEFDKRGVKVIALSSDGRERAQAMADKLKAPGLRMGYDLALRTAREWGLYVSTSRGKTSIGIEEPALFSEPGLFIVRPDSTLYYGAVQTMPFARPHFDDLLAAIDFAVEKNYPARGEYAGELEP
jgi:peroxiredoxin